MAYPNDRKPSLKFSAVSLTTVGSGRPRGSLGPYLPLAPDIVAVAAPTAAASG